MDVASGVAVGLMRLSLPTSGKLRGRLLIDSAICAAVMTDLALTGRLSNGPAGLVVDPEPTRIEPVDDLLVEMAAAPPRSVQWWLNTGRPGEQDMADYLVGAGEWARLDPTRMHREARYKIADESVARTTAAARRNLPKILSTPPRTPQAAALACIVLGLGLGVEHAHPPADLVARCAPADWVIEGAIDYIDSTREVFAAKHGGTLRTSMSSLTTSIKGALEERHYR